MQVDVDADAFVAASAALAAHLACALEDAYQTLSIELGGCTAMAGSDAAGTAFSDEYDRAGPQVAVAVADLDTAARRLGALLQATGFNHWRADTASDAARAGYDPVDETVYDVSAPSRYGLPGGAGAIVPPSAGGSGEHPGGWGLVRALVGWEWPDGRQDRLHRAAHAWQHLADRLTASTAPVDEAIAAIRAQRSPEVPDAVAACTRLRTHLLDVAAASGRLAHGCDRLAGRIDAVHGAVRSTLEWLVALSAATQVVGAVVSIFTLGIGEGAAQTAETAEIKIAASEIETYLATFFAETTDITLLVSRVDSEVLAVTRSLEPLLAADIHLADTQFVAALPDVRAFAPLSRLAAFADFRATLGPRLRGYLLDDTGAIGSWSTSARIRQAGLPSRGPIRFVPSTKYRPRLPLPRGTSHGYIDRFDNEWVKGPSRTPGEPYEWDVTLSPQGRASIGWLSRDGIHVNVSLNGWVTH